MGLLKFVPPGREPFGVGEVGQQVAVVEVGGRAEAGLVCLFQRLGGGPFELQDVDGDRARVVQHDLLIVDLQQPVCLGAEAGERTAGHIQGLVQVSCGGFGFEVRPQPVQHLLAVAALARRQREHRDQRFCLAQPPLPGRGGAAVNVHGERSEELDAQLSVGGRHG